MPTPGAIPASLKLCPATSPNFTNFPLISIIFLWFSEACILTANFPEVFWGLRFLVGLLLLVVGVPRVLAPCHAAPRHAALTACGQDVNMV